MSNHEAIVTDRGEVTIPPEVRRVLGLADGGPVVFTNENGIVTLRAARQPTLSELLSGFDPVRHRHAPAERVWDDAPAGTETL